MRLLIITQSVDYSHPILGFFHRWLQEFSRHVDDIHVICLQEGPHDLPKNVHVYSLRKEYGASKLSRGIRFYRLIWSCRYDAVLVHMNPEYVMLGGLLWRLWGMRIGLWYVHKAVNFRLRLAHFFVHRVFTASPESFRLASTKVCILGHGIDTEFFTPDTNVMRGSHVLSVGRLTKSKRHDLAIDAARTAGVELHIIGDGPERDHLETYARSCGVRAHFCGGLDQEGVREEYRRAAFLVHTSETGSMDKVVLEALACDLAVVTTSVVYKQFPVQVVPPDAGAIARAIVTPQETHERAAYIQKHFALSELIPRIISELSI